jgi:hypothetical protein
MLRSPYLLLQMGKSKMRALVSNRSQGSMNLDHSRWLLFLAVGLIALLSVVERTSAFATYKGSSHQQRFLHRFPTPTPTGRCCSSTALQIGKTLKEDDGDSSGLSYGERSRPFRRDVFDYDAWVYHRRTDRYVSHLFNVFNSGVTQQLLREVYLTTAIATFVCVYNALFVNGFDDFVGFHHEPFVQGFYVFSLPTVFFSLTSPALSLLLGK